jgi:hypothetical protein
MSQFTSLIRHQQLASLLRRAARYRQAGESVPYDLQICIALAQNRIPDPAQDKRLGVEDTKTSRRLMHINRGKRITSPSQSGLWRGGRHWNGHDQPHRGRLSTIDPVPQPSRHAREYHWRKLARPIKVSTDDWELLRLATVGDPEPLTAPQIAAKLGGSVTAAAVRKRLQRARAAAKTTN